MEHDPGGKVRLAMLPGTRGNAGFSECGRYRHWLSRNWQPPGEMPPKALLFIGMNPSTAEADVDDPTIRREIEFSKRFGASAYVKVNVMDYRATSPKQLLAQGVNPCSDENREVIRRAAESAAKIIVCWGKLHRPLRRYADNTLGILRGRELWCLGKNADGSPRHPLYLPGATPLEKFP